VRDVLDRTMTAAEIDWELAPAPWPSERPALELAREALPALDDPLAVGIIGQLTVVIHDLREELAAKNELLSEALTFATAKAHQAINARRRLAESFQQQRRAR
jgi:hypothetical protein